MKRAILAVGCVLVVGIVGLLLLGCGGSATATVHTTADTTTTMLTTTTLAPTMTTMAPTTTSTVSVAYQAKLYMADALPRVTEWDDAVSLAGQTPKIALAGPIANLQRIRRDVAAMPAYDGLEDVQTKLLNAMDSRIKGYLAFMGGQSDTLVQGYFGLSDLFQSQWNSALQATSKQ